MTGALIGPVFSAAYPLIGKKWFAGMQMRALRIREDLFDDYFRDSSAIRKDDMIAFIKASTSYALKGEIRNTTADVHVYYGSRETGEIRRSAERLRDKVAVPFRHRKGQADSGPDEIAKSR